MKIYLAGPMRGIARFNFPAFDEAAARGRALGHEIISPAEIDRNHGVDETNAPMTFDHNGHSTAGPGVGPVIDLAFMRGAAARDCAAIIGQKDDWGHPGEGYVGGCDAVAMLPGWENSKGATGEKALAEWIGLQVLDSRTFYTLGYEPFCPTCTDGACPSMYEITMQQAREFADKPPQQMQSSLPSTGTDSYQEFHGKPYSPDYPPFDF